jgi:hypothetical protein
VVVASMQALRGPFEGGRAYTHSMRLRLAIAFGAALVALVAWNWAARSNHAGGDAQPPAASCYDPSRPLLGITEPGGGRRRTISELDRLTLRRASPRRVRLGARAEGPAALSPDCGSLAIGTGDAGRLALVDTLGGRTLGSVPLARPSFVGKLAWPEPNRVLVYLSLPQRETVAVVDVPARRLERLVSLPGTVVSVNATPLGLALLLAPTGSIGPVRIALVDAQGRLDTLRLERIRAGSVQPRQRGRLPRRLDPALAVDDEQGRAYVLAAGSSRLLADVDLAAMSASYRKLGPAAGERATAAKGAPGRESARSAQSLGAGLMAVSGEDRRLRRHWRRAIARGRSPVLVRPYGLRLVDATRATIRTLDPRLGSFLVARDTLLGPLWPTPDGGRAVGIAAYGLDGKRRFTRFAGDRRASLHNAAWPYAYAPVRRSRRTHVIDVRSGRTVRVLPTTRLPHLITDAFD